MADEQGDISTAIQRHELDQRSDAGSSEKKAALPTASPDTAPQVAKGLSKDALDIIQQNQTFGYLDPATKQRFDEAQGRQEEQQPEVKKAEAKAEAALPAKLAQFDPEKVKSLLDHYQLTPEDLEADPRWEAVLEADLAQDADSTTKAAEQQPQQQAEIERQHFEGLAQRSQRINDPRMMEVMANSVASFLSDNPNSPEALAGAKGLTEVLAQGGINLIESYVPQVLEQHLFTVLDKVLPGFSDDYAERQSTHAWDAARKSDDRFKSLPDFGTAKFAEMAERIHAENPWLNSFNPTDEKGQPLPPLEALRQRALVSAKLAHGEQFSGEEAQKQIAQAIETGKKLGAESKRTYSAAKSLGGGRSRGELTPSEKSNPLRDAILSYEAGKKTGRG